MADGDDEIVMVNNNYRSAIASARTASMSPASRLEDALASARTALESGAWTGAGADDFGADLAGHRSALNAAGPAALETFDDALAAQPLQVPRGSWQVNWNRMGPI